MTRKALVIGAGGAVGEAAAMALLREGWRVTASMRRERQDVAQRLGKAGAEVVAHGLPNDASWIGVAHECDALIFTTHLAITSEALALAPPLDARIVAFSSNNVAADADAPSYRALALAEAELRARYPAAAIIRPTMIYGDPRLVTVSRLIELARRSPVLPLPGSGQARVQPVFHRDLGELAAMLAGADAPSGVFAAGGPDIVPMRVFYESIAEAAGVRPLVLPLSGVALSLAAALKLISAEQAARAERDRTAITQYPLPPELAPRTPLSEGLALHARALSAAAQGGA